MAAKIVARFAGMIVYEEAEALIYATEKGEVARLSKPPLHVEQPDPSRWAEGFFSDLTAALNDPLAEQALAAGEPDFASVARLLPPLRDLAFLGDEATLDRLEVTPDGAVVGRDDLPPPPVGKTLSAGLLDGWLPALVYQYDAEAGPVELLQFATVSESGGLDLWRRVKSGVGFGATFAYTRNAEEVPDEEFYARLLSLWERWVNFRKEGLRVELPEAELQTAALGMLVLGTLTFRGLISRYGVGWYDEPRAHSFPPAVLFLVQSLLAWGHTQRALEIFAHYLAHYTLPDGTVDYYGPAVAEYGQLLTLAAECLQLTGDESWLEQRLSTLRPMWQRLLALRAESLRRYPKGDIHRGLIPGLPEADYHAMEKEWDTFYYSGDVWVSRGLREMGHALQALDQPGLHTEGAALVAEAEAYRLDILASLAAVMPDDARYVPPGPDQTDPIEQLTPETHPSYCNYRYLLEMLSAGVLPGEVVTKVAAWRRAHGGELLTGTRFSQQMDDWPALHYARGLLETDDLDHYLLLLYSHWAHHCAQGTLSSYEQVRIEPDETGTRRMVAGQVLPCQVMVPTMLRWGLVYEERDADVLWLCRAIPKRWLAPDQEINIRRVPTRFGKVGFTIKMTGPTAAKITLRLPDDPLAAAINLRLRHPQGLTLAAALEDEQPADIQGETLRLPAGLKGKIKIAVGWQ